MEKKYWTSLALASLCLWSSCGKKATTTKTEKPVATNVACPSFHADSAYQFTADQCDFGPRVPNTEAHRKCGNYIVGKFKMYGTEVTEQIADVRGFDGAILKNRNIIAPVNPDAKARVLLCVIGTADLGVTTIRTRPIGKNRCWQPTMVPVVWLYCLKWHVHCSNSLSATSALTLFALT